MADNRYRLTQAEIAERLNRTRVAIHTAMTIRGWAPGVLKGERHWRALHTDKDVELCRALYDEGLTALVIAEKMEISVHSVLHWVQFKSRTEVAYE